jgi:hypothetical protein
LHPAALTPALFDEPLICDNRNTETRHAEPARPRSLDHESRRTTRQEQSRGRSRQQAHADRTGRAHPRRQVRRAQSLPPTERLNAEMVGVLVRSRDGGVLLNAPQQAARNAQSPSPIVTASGSSSLTSCSRPKAQTTGVYFFLGFAQQGLIVFHSVSPGSMTPAEVRNALRSIFLWFHPHQWGYLHS